MISIKPLELTMHLHIEMIETLLEFTFLDTSYIFLSFQKQKVHGANILKHLKVIS